MTNTHTDKIFTDESFEIACNQPWDYEPIGKLAITSKKTTKSASASKDNSLSLDNSESIGERVLDNDDEEIGR